MKKKKNRTMKKSIQENSIMENSILNYFEVKQRDSNSEARSAPQTGEKVQKRINPTSKKKGNNGRIPLKKLMNNFSKDEVKEGPSKSHVQQCNEGKSHTFNFKYKNNIHAVACDTSKTVLDALNTNMIFKTIKKANKEKDILIKRSKGEVLSAAVKTDFPCCLIEKDELLDITFINNTGHVNAKKTTTGRLSFSNESENLVIFYIKTKGGEKVKFLMKNYELRNKVDHVCVYAFKEDKLKAALRRDGRFTKAIFRKQCALRELGSEITHVMSNTVEHLDGKHFEIIVISDRNQPDSQDDILSDVSTEMNEASAAVSNENVDPNQHPVNSEQETPMRNPMKSTNTSTKYSKIINSKEIQGILCSQLNGLIETLKKRENLKNMSQVKTFFRAEYDKSVQSFLEVKKVKQLMRLSEHVCQIRVEGSARGTGFLLFDRFILTNAHVIGEFDPFSRKLSKTFTAVFGYEDLEANETKCVSIKEQVAAYYHGKDEMDRYLDFALLELKATDEIAHCPGLLSRYLHGPPPNRGKICIVGHPEGGTKKMDPCFIIGKENLQEAAEKHISENFNFIHMIIQQSLEEKWKMYDNQIHYDSCFFHGSSGSPVFDEHCYLVGMHTGGYVYPGKKDKIKSIVEYAYSMQPTMESIIAQAKNSGRSDILKLLSENKALNINLEDNDVDMEMDA